MGAIRRNKRKTIGIDSQFIEFREFIRQILPFSELSVMIKTASAPDFLL
jgi:hypothetical protein